jgi:hypothetical protein
MDRKDLTDRRRQLLRTDRRHRMDRMLRMVPMDRYFQ